MSAFLLFWGGIIFLVISYWAETNADAFHKTGVLMILIGILVAIVSTATERKRKGNRAKDKGDRPK